MLIKLIKVIIFLILYLHESAAASDRSSISSQDEVTFLNQTILSAVQDTIHRKINKPENVFIPEVPIQPDFEETHPTLGLKSYEFFVLNRTITQLDNGIWKIPRVFTHLVFECNSTLPTRWHFSGRVRDAHVKNLYVKKFRHYNDTIKFRSTIHLDFRNPEALENLTCQNECTPELKSVNKSCLNLWSSAIVKDPEYTFYGDPFIYIYFSNGTVGEEAKSRFSYIHIPFDFKGKAWRLFASSQTILDVHAKGITTEHNITYPGCDFFCFNRSGNAAGRKTFKLGSDPECNFTLHIDLKDGRYECSKTNGSVEVEMPTVYLPCANLDECHMFYQKENKTSCPNRTLIQTSCSGKNCYRLRAISSPFIVSCGEDAEKSVARSYFPLTLVSGLNGSVSTQRDHELISFPDVVDDFAEIFNNKCITVLKINTNSTEPLYTGDSRVFHCTGIKSVFSCGFRWFLVYRNETVKRLGIGTEQDDSNDQVTTTYVSTISVTFDSDEVKLVKCDAPWWNSFKWAHTNFTVNVTNVIQPSFNNFGQKCSSAGCSCEDIDRRAIFTCPKNGSPRGHIKWKIDAVDVNPVSTEKANDWYVIAENETHSELRLNSSKDRYEEAQTVQCSIKNREEIQVACHLFRIKRGFSVTLILGIAIGSIVVLSAVLLLLSWYKIKRQKEKLHMLPDEEVEEFENGNPNGTEAFLLPYNMDLEIPPEDLIISGQVLGSGAFAQVMKGQVGLTTVAIKRLKKTADVVYMRALLSELKIMSYVGQHPHIVNLVGSCTRDIRKRELSVILEFCERGDLLSLLRNGRKVFVDKFECSGQPLSRHGGNIPRDRCSTIVYQNASVKKLSTINLLKWAHEIASGMEFLSSKNVIHGDLAGRNILVTYDLRAKVSDFGLSKQLFDYSIYVQKINIPLPLRWMAYESLKDLEFSIESDIWSYGVVLWELFTLGEAPYPGMEWGFGAWKLILNGHRMEKPAYASDAVYKVMLQCWDIQPNARPTFKHLKQTTLEFWREMRQLSMEIL